MRRGIKTFTALTLLALAIVAVSYGGSSAPKNLASTASAPNADRPTLMKQHRGGTLKLVAKAAGGTIDPHVNYTLQYWQLYQATYDGLLGFEKAGGNAAFTVVPDLATAIPTPTNGGKTWTFKLRNGIKFSNGQPVTTNDVVASFRRIFKVKSPTSGGFYAGIVGAAACLKTPATCTLKGGVSANAAARTVTINLTAPDPEFKYKLSVPHASILPANTPPKDVGTKPIPGTGPYYFKSYNPNRSLVMARNPYFKEWSVKAQPDGYPDQITQTFGLTVEAQVTAIQNGQADWTLEQPPADRLSEIGTKYASQVHVTPLTAFWYIPMNTNMAPFNKLKARQAFNFAVDRNAAVKIFGGKNLASPSCQVLPPGFPGHQDYCPYTKNPGTKWSAPDVAKAKRLVKESGTLGQKVTVVVPDDEVNKAMGVYTQSVLNQIGYKASVKAISGNIFFTFVQNTKNKVQINVQQWYQDYPAASDFLNILFGCDSFHPGSDSSINIAGFCDKKIDAQMKHALALASEDEDAANAEWTKIDRAVTDAAPMATLFNPKHVDFVSKRVGNFTFSKQFYWLVSQSWVK
jgi:peptide/nickel transport system substrate-binding protein